MARKVSKSATTVANSLVSLQLNMMIVNLRHTSSWSWNGTWRSHACDQEWHEGSKNEHLYVAVLVAGVVVESNGFRKPLYGRSSKCPGAGWTWCEDGELYVFDRRSLTPARLEICRFGIRTLLDWSINEETLLGQSVNICHIL
jgi:hypothetical protein